MLRIGLTEHTANCLFEIRSTPPIVYLLYGSHCQSSICLTEHTAYCSFAQQSTPPIVYMCYGGIEVIEVCQPEDD